MPGNRMLMKILLFGTGDYYNRYKKWFTQQDVIALLDNSEQKHHTFIDGVEVLLPEEGIKLDYDTIVILSFYVRQMKQQLMQLGVEEQRIFHFYDLHQLLGKDRERRTVQHFLNAEAAIKTCSVEKPKILLMSHDMSLGGPAIALFHAAAVLKSRGYDVTYCSMTDGPMREMLIENDIPVIVDENLQVATMQETEWVGAFSLIICNTLNYHVFLSERNIAIPVIWWLHDARFFYDGVNREVIRKISMENLKAVSVGPVPAEAIREFLPDMDCGELLYGVADARHETVAETKDNRINFVTIGFLEDIKGQDVLVQAVLKLPNEIRSRCSFYIVGHDKTLFGERIHKECKSISEMKFTGSVDRREIHRLFREADILVCPSRQDSMPTVAAEAMMHSVPCIVSDVTGTAAYIHDGEDGFIVPSEDAQALAEKMAWCVENRDKLKSMGERARELYEKYFSMPAFEKKFMEIVESALVNASR